MCRIEGKQTMKRTLQEWADFTGRYTAMDRKKPHIAENCIWVTDRGNTHALDITGLTVKPDTSKWEVLYMPDTRVV